MVDEMVAAGVVDDGRRRVSVDVAPDGYLTQVATGRRSGYMRAVVDERLASLRASVKGLRLSGGRSLAEVVRLIESAGLPWATVGTTTRLSGLEDDERQAVALLWREAALAWGGDVSAMLEALDSGVTA